MASIRSRLQRPAALLDSMASLVGRDDRFRILELGCSPGAGGGDELSDIDAAVGYQDIAMGSLGAAAARAFAMNIDTPTDLVEHRLNGWPDHVRRLPAEYPGEMQFDLCDACGQPARAPRPHDRDRR